MTSNRLSQWRVLGKDQWLIASLTWLPMLLTIAIWWIFSQGQARNLPIAVVDLQHSSLSRQLAREFDATASLSVIQTYGEITAAKKAFMGNHIYAYMIIPKNFDRDIYLGRAPQVSLFYNSQYILVGKLINSAAQQAYGTFNAQISVLKSLSQGNTTVASSLAKSITIGTQITPLFNQTANYAQFLVSGIVPAIWQISIVVSSILFLTANHRTFGLKKMLTKRPLAHLLALNFFYLPFFLVQGFAFLIWFYFNLDWPMFGSVVVLAFTQLITAIACMIMANLFFFITLDPARAMSFAAAFTAPSFAFMGVTFPASDMGLLARIWRSFLPISHYIEAQISQVSYGVSAWQTLSVFLPVMAVYLIPLLLVIIVIKVKLKKQERSNETV